MTLDRREDCVAENSEEKMGMDVKPEKKHAWLHKLVGDWTAETARGTNS